MSGFSAFKLNCVKSYIIKSLSSGLVLSQIYVNHQDWKEINQERAAKFSSIGVFFTGPLLAHWSLIMQKSVAKTTSPLSIALQKTLCTQIFLAPSLNFGIITIAGTLNGTLPTKSIIRDTLREDFFTVMEKNFLIWLPVQFTGCIIRFPVIKYVLTNLVSVIWFAYLSSILMD